MRPSPRRSRKTTSESPTRSSASAGERGFYGQGNRRDLTPLRGIYEARLNEAFRRFFGKLYPSYLGRLRLGTLTFAGIRMGKQILGVGRSFEVAQASVAARLNLDIEQYEELLRNSLGPKARKMFEHLLARAKSELAVIEAEESVSRSWLASSPK